MNELLHTPLSERELEILKLVAQGKSNKEIASELFISVNTVKVHLAKIFQRIGVASRTEATLYAIEHEHVENPNHTLVSPQDPEQDARVELVVPETVTVERPVVRLTPAQLIRKFWWAFGLGLLLLSSFTVAWNKGWIFSQPTPDPILAAMNVDRWKELAPMSVARANMAVTVYDNKIYVIGGETEQGVTGLTEVYDIATNTWARLPDKPTPVTNAKAAVIGGKIFVPGGIDNKGNEINAVEYYNTQDSTWQRGPQLPVGISDYAISVWDRRILVLGGQDSENITADIISLNPEESSWRFLGKLPVPLKQFALTQSNDSLVVFGGSSLLRDVDTIYKCQPTSGDEMQVRCETSGRLPFAMKTRASFITEFHTILLEEAAKDQRILLNLSDIRSEAWTSTILEANHNCPAQSIAYSKGVLYFLGGSKASALTCNTLTSVTLIFSTNLPVIIR